ncbi:aspartate/glutamate racemase family protein [Rhodovulum sulfidophilum]|uniref:aspartate/glutamate racemase family protein n=1 Tax=Rhodovulum sulfidophilum TaxID=35806 RepID=UPI00138A12FF|nr:aspartate/glutamate racemase family protein [Rhodovulum sulfidophilum]MBL3586703.1 aspartate/glutamate racemase family protein [Rhodovulum sulfidophilum]NDK36074.1 hydrogenase expression protein HupH [Rhodovulum sulfidophilum]
MRLLLVNPNMTGAMTDRMAGIARDVASPGTEIVPLTAGRGFPYIASRAEAQIGGALACEMIADHAEGADAAIIAAFGDPGLAGARELFDLPVVGMAEAALVSAAMLGERISIVTFSPVMRRWYLDSVRDAGLSARFAGVRTPDGHAPDLGDVQQSLREDLIRLCNRAVREDGADVVVLGGAPLAGLAPEIRGEVEAPVVDPISAATLQAQALAVLAPQAGFAGRASKPLPKTATGLPPALTRQFACG